MSEGTSRVKGILIDLGETNSVSSIRTVLVQKTGCEFQNLIYNFEKV